VEPAPGRFDFSGIDEQLAAVRKAGRVATIQINQNDAGALQYWRPAHVEANSRLIAAFGAHVKQSPMRSTVLGVRLTFNGLGTEPLDEYRRRIVNEFIKDFAPDVRLFVPNSLVAGSHAEPAWVRMVEAGRLALFQTSSDLEPRDPSQYDALIRYCRSGRPLLRGIPGRFLGTAGRQDRSAMVQSGAVELLAAAFGSEPRRLLYRHTWERPGQRRRSGISLCF